MAHGFIWDFEDMFGPSQASSGACATDVGKWRVL